MVLRQVRIGSLLNAVQYDDGDYDSAVETDQPMKAGTPIDPNDVVRLSDLGTYVTGPISAVDSNIAEFDGITGKVLKDGGLTHAEVAAASAASHARSHSIISTSDHTSAATPGQILKADANGLPIDATNTDAAVAGAVAASHAEAHAIPSHSDANLGAISNNDLMQWDDPSTKWLPKSAAEVIAGQNIAPGPVTIGSVEDWRYAAAIADDGIKALPEILANYAAIVNVIISSIGVIDANATFMIDSTGTVTPQVDSGNCVYNVDTDVKLCIGTAAAQNPLTIKYRLGSAVAKIMITMMYVKA